MLRIGFLPSDFNPMLLMLGEAEDLRALGGTLRQFARGGTSLPLHEQNFCAARGVRVTLRRESGVLGLHHETGSADGFVWRLDTGHAEAFADQVDGLATAARRAGSEMLECASVEEEIAVKVSRGEYTDDFLADVARSR